MKILAVDTALGACSAALLDDELIRVHCFEQMERGHAERIASMVHEAMTASGVGFADLDRLAVTVGPGTFTGQRVGYAFMRALRLALKKPLIGVTTLAAMAQAAMAESGARGAVVLHDAKRGEVYAYAEVDGATVLPVQLTTLEAASRSIVDATDSFDGVLALAGTASGFASECYRAKGRAADKTQVCLPDALWVARIALHEPEPDTLPRPLYLRPPDARLPEAVPTITSEKFGSNAS